MRLEKDSIHYRLICRWIEQGMPYGKPDDPKVDRIEVLPADAHDAPRRPAAVGRARPLHRRLDAKTSPRMAQFEPNDTEMAEVSADAGWSRRRDLSGDVAVMARYQGQVAVFRASFPLGAPWSKNLPPPKNFIDELVFAS